MEFKVGNKVKLIRTEDENINLYKKYLGHEFEIREIFNGMNPHCTLKGNNKIAPYLKNLELIKEYTYEDLKKSPIGTKITFEDGKLFVKNGEDKFESPNSFTYIDNVKGLTNYNFGKIIKIEEPKYKTVYEAKIEILDEVEKRYLKNVIRPFRDKVKSIEKFIFATGNANINIKIKRDKSFWSIDLPPFKKDTMYKNMEDDKEYTLEELGL